LNLKKQTKPRISRMTRTKKRRPERVFPFWVIAETSIY